MSAPISVLPADHPERRVLADEVHARPPEPLETPSRASYVAVLVDADARAREHAHLGALCAAFGVQPPPPDATHFRAALRPALRIKWERHGEFTSYTFYRGGSGRAPFADPPVALLPPGWLARVPGRTMAAAHAELSPASAAPPDAAELTHHFGGHLVIGAEIGDGAGLAHTDFRLHDDGFARFLVHNRSFSVRQAGRILQRLFEIEAYRMMALLALPIARAQMPRIVPIESALARLTADIAAGEGTAADDERLLHQLTGMAAEVEQALAAGQFRFGACRAYADLVATRIAELRERRLPGLQPIDEFMARRFKPAVATVQTTAQRLHDLSERVAQASALLSTRVDIARERQNQALLASMDRRAKLQLRLQQTVEGLSVAAIAYYMVGLVSYLAKGAKAAGLRLDPDLTVGLAVPAVVLMVMWGLRRARQHLTQRSAARGTDP